MATDSKLVGKSLLKYFKPVRTGSLEREATEKSTKGFELFITTQKNAQKTVVLKSEVAGATATAAKHENVVMIPKPDIKGTWLDQVVYLVQVCKQVSGKMGRSLGITTYKSVMSAQVRQKMKVVGSIVNVTNGADEMELNTAVEKTVPEKKKKTKKQKTPNAKAEEEDQVELSEIDEENESAA